MLAGANPYYLTRLARLASEQVDTMYQRLIQQVPGCEGEDGKKVSRIDAVPRADFVVTQGRSFFDASCS